MGFNTFDNGGAEHQKYFPSHYALLLEEAAHDFPVEIERLAEDLVVASVDIEQNMNEGLGTSPSARLVLESLLDHIRADDALGHLIASTKVLMRKGTVVDFCTDPIPTLLKKFESQIADMTIPSVANPQRPSMSETFLAIYSRLREAPDRSIRY